MALLAGAEQEIDAGAGGPCPILRPGDSRLPEVPAFGVWCEIQSRDDVFGGEFRHGGARSSQRLLTKPQQGCRIEWLS